MKKKSETEMTKFKIAKTMRTLIRLKHSLEADEEINELLPAKLGEYDKSLVDGEVMKLANTVDDLLGSGECSS